MRNPIETIVLFVGVLTLGTLHLTPLADANPDPVDGAAAPTQIPLDAMVTGADVLAATVDELTLSLDRQPNGGATLLRIENRGASVARLDWDVDCASMRGSMMSRMGPLEVPLGTKRVALTLAPGASEIVELVAATTPSAGAGAMNTNANANANANVAIFPGAIDTTRVRVMAHSDERMRAVAAAEAAQTPDETNAFAAAIARFNSGAPAAGDVLAFLQAEE